MSTNQWELLQKIGFVRVSGSAEEKQAAEILREEVEARGEKARLVKDAMCYGIVKQIGAMAAALGGRVDAVVLTGGIAHNKPVVEYISEFCSFIAPISVYPGENELESLVTNALVVLRGTITPKVYA